MKFGQELQTRLTPEWRKQYIHYEELKRKLYELDTAKLDLDNDTDQRLAVAKAKADDEFLGMCELELTKVNLFFGLKLAEAQGKYNELTQELESFTRLAKGADSDKVKPLFKIIPRPKTAKTSRTKHQIKFAFSEFYLSLVLLQKYQEMNSIAFKKILKKRDKIFGDSKGLEWRQSRVEKAEFYTNKLMDKLIVQVEDVFIQSLEGGDRTAGMKRLKVPPLSEKEHAWTTYRLGLFQGCFAVLLILIVLTLLRRSSSNEPKWVGVRLFRGFMILFTNIWLLGFNMYGWHRAGVNHVLIFDIDPRHHLRYQGLLEIGSFFCMLWAIAVLAYLYPEKIHPGASPLLMPLLLMLVCVVWLCNPFNVFHRSSRIWFIKRVCYCFAAPFRHVSFCDFWLADQMNSLVTFFLDMQYFMCFYLVEVDYSGGNVRAIETTNSTSGVDYATGQDVCTSNVLGIRPIISVIPALIRFLQCLRRYYDSRSAHPHLTNAGKYATSFFVVIFGALYRWQDLGPWKSPFLYCWVGAYLISFVYTFTWDVKMDWGFFASSSKQNKFLRDELIYDHKCYYYLAIVQDLMLRLAWVLNVSLGAEVLDWENDFLMCITAPLECIRRFIWNYFRLENEHVNNCGHFRATRDISLRPLKQGEMELLLKKMDLDDGVTHRPQGPPKKRKRKPAKRSRPMQAVKSFQTFFRPTTNSKSSTHNYNTVSNFAQLSTDNS